MKNLVGTKNISSIILLSFVHLCLSCAPFRDSPFSDQVLNPERNLNSVAIQQISAVEADGKIRIAVFTDSHQNYKDLDLVIRNVNRIENIDFVVSLGDVTNSGYNFEFDQFLGSFLRLQRPAINILGNHDALGVGVSIFKNVFGELNFYFESSTKRFVFFNSANLEDSESFDPQWLGSAVSTSNKPVIIFTHVPLGDPERYQGATKDIMRAVIQDPKTQLILNGHNHVYVLSEDSGTVTLQSGRAEGGQWLLLEIQGSQLSIQRMEVGSVEWATLKN